MATYKPEKEALIFSFESLLHWSVNLNLTQGVKLRIIDFFDVKKGLEGSIVEKEIFGSMKATRNFFKFYSIKHLN